MLNEVKSLPTGEAGASGGENEKMEPEVKESPGSAKSQQPRQSGGQASLKSKIIWWVLGIILLGAIGYGIYYLKVQNSNVTCPPKQAWRCGRETVTQNPSTADWKTYENKDYGFSFKYPGDWNVKWDDNLGETIIDSPIQNNQLPVSEGIRLKVESGEAHKIIEKEYINNYTRLKKIQNNKAYIITILGDEGSYDRIYIPLSSNTLYLKTYNIDTDQILSTFRFTK